MSSVLNLKKQKVEEIVEKFEGSQTSVVVDYRGLDVAAVTDLRKELRDAGVELHVYKNTMTRRAVDEIGIDINEILVGPNAIAFGKDDVIAPARILNNFAKTNDALEIKGGIIEGKVATVEQIQELAELPNYEGMVSMLLSVLQAPIRNLAYAVKSVADQKEEEEGA